MNAIATVLRKLANEVAGLKAFEPEIRQAIGNTNWTILQQRVNEADEALADRATNCTLIVAAPGMLASLERVRPIIAYLIAQEYNVDTWGLHSLLAEIDSAPLAAEASL